MFDQKELLDRIMKSLQKVEQQYKEVEEVKERTGVIRRIVSRGGERSPSLD